MFKFDFWKSVFSKTVITISYSSYTPWNYLKTRTFLIFLWGIEKLQVREIGLNGYRFYINVDLGMICIARFIFIFAYILFI